MKSNYKTTSTTPCKSRDESNEAFDRVNRGRLLQYRCSKSLINYRHQIHLKKLHPSLKRFCKQTTFSTPCIRYSLFEKRARKKPNTAKCFLERQPCVATKRPQNFRLAHFAWICRQSRTNCNTASMAERRGLAAYVSLRVIASYASGWNRLTSLCDSFRAGKCCWVVCTFGSSLLPRPHCLLTLSG